MSYRIIDQTEATTITGTESIPGTQQTSTGDTTPLNVRWVWNNAVMTWIKSWMQAWLEPLLIETGSCNKITSHAFLIADVTYEYTATRYEFVETIILKGLATGETATIDYYTFNLATGSYDANSITVEDSNIININNYFDSSVTFERNISISPSANCTIIIKSVKGL